MVLRVAGESDLDRILLWRNCFANRSVMFNPEIITKEQHFSWWIKVKDDDSKRILIFEFNGIASGVVIFFDIDPSEKIGHWGFYMDVELLASNKKSISAWIALEQESIRYAREVLNLKVLVCETLERNKAVLKLHLLNKFKVVRTYEKTIQNKSEIVVETQLRM
jgi:UDP-4-amino-4,6-dideoxy-N-acetyl-beta-L-altrosamine N-acetyltransferase